MNNHSRAHEKMMAALELLRGATLSVSSFEHIGILLKGVHPELDKKLAICSQAFDKLQKIQSGDVITLTAEGLPEDTDEQKKRKKAVLFFISSVKDLQSEIKRVDAELSHVRGHAAKNQAGAWGRILKSAKGSLGIITVVAVVIVGFFLLSGQRQNDSAVSQTITSVTPAATQGGKVEVILYQGKQIPLSQLHVGKAHIPNCDSDHYHGNNGRVTAVGGAVIADPGNCGFGKVKDEEVLEIALP